MDTLLLVNKALMKCGLPLATSLDQYDWNARMVFEERAEDALRSWQWGFAERFVTLAPNSTPPHGYAYSYVLPSDCLRIVGVHGRKYGDGCRVAYSRAGSQIYCDAPQCHLRYVARILDPDQWPPDFAEAVSCAIAAEIATLSAETMALAPNLYELYQQKLAACQITDAAEHAGHMERDRELWLVRGVPGAHRPAQIDCDYWDFY